MGDGCSRTIETATIDLTIETTVSELTLEAADPNNTIDEVC